MSALLILTTLALLGSALIGGVFFAFSSFVMRALARAPAQEGIAAMQLINVTVINRSFLGAFMGTTVVSLVIVATTITALNNIILTEPAAIFALAGATLYFVGTFLVTMLGNVPLNKRLASVAATDTSAHEVWKHYLQRWTLWNHVRTLAATMAAVFYVLGLMQ